MVKLKQIILFSGLFCVFLPLYAAKITATISPLNPSVEDRLTLTLSATEKPDGQPDLSVLEANFEILGNAKSENMSMTNGHVQRRIQWQISLFAKKAGTIKIPAIKFGQDQSNPLTINIAKTSHTNSPNQAKDILLLLESDQKEVYSQQQIIIKLRFLYQINLRQASITPPTTNDPDAELIQLTQTESKVIDYQGSAYNEVIVTYALIPSKIGTLEIDPVLLQGFEQATQRGRFSAFGFRGQGKRRRLYSNKLSFTVKTPPTDALKPWLPAKNLVLSETWDKKEWMVGESITRSIILIADGVNQPQLPDLEMNLNHDFKQYPEKANIKTEKHADGLSASLTQKFTIIPTKAGQFKIPEIKINWWNTQTNQAETAILPTKTVKVLVNPEQPIFQPLKTPTVATHPLMETDNKNIERVTTPQTAESNHKDYLGLAIFFAVLWLITSIILFFNKRQEKAKSRTIIKNPPTISKVNLKKACKSNNPHAIKQALLIWGKKTFQKNSPQSLSALARLAKSEKLSQEIQQLDKTLYHKKTEYKDGMKLYQAILLLPPQTSAIKNKDFIPPLYNN